MSRSTLLGLILGFALVGCSQPQPGDAGGDAGTPDDVPLDPHDVAPVDDVATDVPDPHGGLRLARCEDTEPAGPITLAPVASTLVGTIVPTGTPVGAVD